LSGSLPQTVDHLPLISQNNPTNPNPKGKDYVNLSKENSKNCCAYQ
jgi:hypothetical protein